jgi:hypothetical protein
MQKLTARLDWQEECYCCSVAIACTRVGKVSTGDRCI